VTMPMGRERGKVGAGLWWAVFRRAGTARVIQPSAEPEVLFRDQKSADRWLAQETGVDRTFGDSSVPVLVTADGVMHFAREVNCGTCRGTGHDYEPGDAVGVFPAAR
jgi:hypothetical protein